MELCISYNYNSVILGRPEEILNMFRYKTFKNNWFLSVERGGGELSTALLYHKFHPNNYNETTCPT